MITWHLVTELISNRQVSQLTLGTGSWLQVSNNSCPLNGDKLKDVQGMWPVSRVSCRSAVCLDNLESQKVWVIRFLAASCEKLLFLNRSLSKKSLREVMLMCRAWNKNVELQLSCYQTSKTFMSHRNIGSYATFKLILKKMWFLCILNKSFHAEQNLISHGSNVKDH